MASPSPDDDTPHESTSVNPYWKAVVVTSFLFVGTTLAIVMTQFGDPQSPSNIFLRRRGPLLAAIEVGAVLISGVMAMAIDQKQSREAARPPSSPPQPPSPDESPDVG